MQDFDPRATDLNSIESRLGPPAFRDRDVLIYQGDSLSLMPTLRSRYMQLTVTSPPYNIGKEYETPLELKNYLAWSETWLGQIYEITRPDGAFWLNLGYLSLPGRAKAVPIPYLLWDRIPFFLIQEIVWSYGAGVASRHSFSPRNEKFLWYVKDERSFTFNLDAVRDPDVKYPNQKKHGKLKCNPNGKNPTDVWAFPKVTSGQDRSSAERTPHPAQFPLAVVERIILACSHEGDIIFDPFLGSGTVAEAALRTKRRVVGFELEPRYVRVAIDRLNRYLAQTSLFDVQA